MRPKITDCISAFAEAEEMHEKIAEGAARTAKWLAAQPNDPMSLLRALDTYLRRRAGRRERKSTTKDI